ncbi:MAG: peptidoglycan editing factor PgeF [Defluviitaleaceae bacterium]|nr:peptidoglycan editing factor PgeF [Defluviitaleaceae bacterium]
MILEKNGLKYFVFKHITDIGIPHCISTRVGGVSSGVYSSLNLTYTTGDDKDAVDANYQKLCDALGFDMSNMAKTKQVHGTNIAKVDEAGVYGDTDGLMTNKTGIALTTYYADCVPLLFYDPKKNIAANAHAGWRGVAEDMAGKVVAAMIKQYGCDPKDVLVGIGPSISVKNFVVGQDVANIFKKQLPFSEEFIYNSRNEQDKLNVDLWQICRSSLLRAGVIDANIEIAGLCTYDNDQLFFSHRRDGMARGGMAAFIKIKNEK